MQHTSERAHEPRLLKGEIEFSHITQRMEHKKRRMRTHTHTHLRVLHVVVQLSVNKRSLIEDGSN